MTRKIDSAGLAALQLIREARADQDRRIQEFKDSIEPRLQAIRVESEDALVHAIAKARRTPGLSKRSIMEAARTMNWDRWIALEKKSDIYLEEYVPDATSAIEYEIRFGDPERNVAGLTRYFGDKPTLRVFKLRTIRYPETRPKGKEIGTDRVIWDTEAPEFDSPDFGFNISNPGWGNAPNIGFGPDRDEVLSAILAWIEKNPEAPE